MVFNCWVQLSGEKNGTIMLEGETHELNQATKYRFRAYLFTYIEGEGYVPLQKQVTLRKNGVTFSTETTDNNGIAWFAWYEAPTVGESYVYDAMFAGDANFNPAVTGTITIKGVAGGRPSQPVPVPGFSLTFNVNKPTVAVNEKVVFSGKATFLVLGVLGGSIVKIEIVKPGTYKEFITIVLSPTGEYTVDYAFDEVGTYKATAKMYLLYPLHLMAPLQLAPVQSRTVTVEKF